jgi:hypothetical protein
MLYFGEMDSKFFCLAEKLCSQSSILARLSSSSSNLPKEVPMGPMYGREDTSL